MVVEARAASCFSSAFVLKVDGRAVGKFEERALCESLYVQLTGRRRLVFQNVEWFGSRFVLTDAGLERPLGGGHPSGLLSSGWELELSSGTGRLERAGWFTSVYEYTCGGRVRARVNLLGGCERGWVVESCDTLTRDDLLVIGLVYHVAQRRQDQQTQVNIQSTGS